MTIEIPTLEDLMQAGAHFGHKTHRWHPNMRRFIYGEKKGTHLINLTKTQEKLEEALDFLQKAASEGKSILLVGTKRQAQDITEEYADRAEIPYVSERWTGGLLTNFSTIKSNISRMKELEEWKEEGFPGRTKKEGLILERELEKIKELFNGVRDLKEVPDVLVILDPHFDDIAVSEGNNLDIPIVGLSDTNINPEELTYPVPANDDAVTSLELFADLFTQAIEEGKQRGFEEPEEAGSDDESQESDEGEPEPEDSEEQEEESGTDEADDEQDEAAEEESGEESESDDSEEE